ncbi:hypothetical protein [Methylocapsa acidiphila]|uniref:hypothetical protein n=1 Tax=Methylocapsa acidiphila TaxID=133552 RepID=UPI0003F611D1|nr:hypothetical protein [Methylocapsa acidiphila]
MTATGPSAEEERLIREAQANFTGFFRWISVLNEMIQKEIGPNFGLIVNNPEVSAAEGRVAGVLEASRPGKPVLSIPFAIIGEQINFEHEKFALSNRATGEKSSVFTNKAIDDMNRLLSDIVQDYIG